MSNQFSYNVWRTYYDDIKKIGAYLKECRDLPRVISHIEREEKTKEADNLARQCANYMDAHQMRMPKPLWYFSIKDTTTQLSHEDFAFHHLIEK